jgi:hypothetical protein
MILVVFIEMLATTKCSALYVNLQKYLKREFRIRRVWVLNSGGSGYETWPEQYVTFLSHNGISGMMMMMINIKFVSHVRKISNKLIMQYSSTCNIIHNTDSITI